MNLPRTQTDFQKICVDNNRVERLRQTLRKVEDITKIQNQKLKIPVSNDYLLERKEFKKTIMEPVNLSQYLYKEATRERRFYPYLKNEPEDISLKDNKPDLEMKSGKMQVYINLQEQILSKTGEQRFKIKEFFNRYPFVTSSIQFETNQYIHPEHQFFVFQGYRSKYKEIAEEVKQQEEFVGSNSKQKFNNTLNGMNFIDIVHLVIGDLIPADNFPKQQNKLSNPAQELEQEVTQNNEEIYIQRIIQCNEKDDFMNEPENIYFTDIETLKFYKKEKIIEIKRLNLYSQEVGVYTDIRNILHPEKVYFLQIINEAEQLINIVKEISQDQEFSFQIVKKTFQMIIQKSTQILYLICSYTSSSIDLQVRLEKLNEYFWMNFMYVEQLHEITPELLEKYNVLKSWYTMPKKIFGFSNTQIQQTYYSLVKAGCKLKKRIQFQDKYHELKTASKTKFQLLNSHKKNKKNRTTLQPNDKNNTIYNNISFQNKTFQKIQSNSTNVQQKTQTSPYKLGNINKSGNKASVSPLKKQNIKNR